MFGQINFYYININKNLDSFILMKINIYLFIAINYFNIIIM